MVYPLIRLQLLPVPQEPILVVAGVHSRRTFLFLLVLILSFHIIPEQLCLHVGPDPTLSHQLAQRTQLARRKVVPQQWGKGEQVQVFAPSICRECAIRERLCGYRVGLVDLELDAQLP